MMRRELVSTSHSTSVFGDWFRKALITAFCRIGNKFDTALFSLNFDCLFRVRLHCQLACVYHVASSIALCS